MSCHKVRRLLAFRREWTVTEERRVEEHLAGCPACRAVAREYELIDRRLERLPAVPAPATLPIAIRAEVGVERRQPAGQVQAAPRPAGQGLLLLVALALLIVAAAVWSTRAPAGPDGPAQTPAPVAWDGTKPARPLTVGNGERVNVLLLGIDSRESASSGPAGGRWTHRTDALVVATLDPVAGTAGMMSIPRDLLLDIPGVGQDRINTANVYGQIQGYPGGGPALVVDTIEANFGIPIDHYIMVDFEGFVEIVDLLGGIEVDVPRTLHDEAYPLPQPGDPDAYGTVHFDPGVQQMDGERALQYARSRMSTSDTDRIEREQQILLAIRDKALRLDLLPKLPDLVSSLGGLLKTDMTAGEMVALARLALGVEPARIERVVIQSPLVVAQVSEEGAAVQMPRWDLISPLVQEIFGGAAPISAAMPEGPGAGDAPGTTQPTPEANSSQEGDALVFTYTVQPGDNVWSIAKGYGLAPETVMWANPPLERSPDLLAVGDVLTIPAADGVLYTVQPGDTLTALAERYETTPAEIVSFAPNGLEEGAALTPGRLVLLAGGRKREETGIDYPLERASEPPEGAPRGSGRFAWPTEGVLTQRYWSGHLAIDIANRTGTPIRAADAGYVILTGRDNWGFGNQVLVDHSNGYLTRYAQLDTIRVRAGDVVDKNQQIGTMGSTGRATGPHLHFEIILDKVRRDPLALLPGGGDEVVLGAGSPVAEGEGAGLAVYGLQAHLLDQETGPAFEALDELGFGWIKQQVQWTAFEAEKGAYDWATLDALVDAADGAGAAMLWSVVGAPDWSRAGQDLTVDGPPNDPGDLADFVGAMAGRYCGRSLKAVEIWDEQNLHFKWGNMAIDPAAYVRLLKAAYEAVKAACPEMVVVSGGLTPTNAPAPKAMEDVRYLEGMYAHGLADYCDAIGVHLPGYNLPPDADWLTYEDPTAGFDGPFRDRHPFWSFRGTADAYRQVMEAQGDAARPVWVTEFGWAVSDDPPVHYEFAGDNTLEEQAAYTLRAFELGHAWDWVEAMFLWNLNFKVVAPGSEKGLWSIVDADWQRTQTYWALADMEK